MEEKKILEQIKRLLILCVDNKVIFTAYNLYYDKNKLVINLYSKKDQDKRVSQSLQITLDKSNDSIIVHGIKSSTYILENISNIDFLEVELLMIKALNVSHSNIFVEFANFNEES